MPLLKILVNEKNEIVGTVRPDVVPTGPGAPQSATLVARKGQRLIEMEVEDRLVSLAPRELHAAVMKEYGKLINP